MKVRNLTVAQVQQQHAKEFGTSITPEAMYEAERKHKVNIHFTFKEILP